MSSTEVYTIGLALIGVSMLVTAIAVPTFLLTGRRLKKQLESEYGEDSRHSKR